MTKTEQNKTDKKKSTKNSDKESSSNTLSKTLLDCLVCPITGGPLRHDTKTNELISEKAKLAFPIIDNIPIMLESEARQLTN